MEEVRKAKREVQGEVQPLPKPKKTVEEVRKPEGIKMVPVPAGSCVQIWQDGKLTLSVALKSKNQVNELLTLIEALAPAKAPDAQALVRRQYPADYGQAATA